MAAPTTGAMLAAIASEWAAVDTEYLKWDDSLKSLQVLGSITRTTGAVTSYALVSSRKISVTDNCTDYLIALSASATKVVSSGKTDSGYMMGIDAIAFRNLANDAGTVAGLYSLRCLAGHYGTPSGSTGTSSNVYGIYLATYHQYGTQTNTYGIYIDKSHAVGPGTYYPLYVGGANTDVSYFVGVVSAYTITDRTKFPSSKEIAYEAIASISKQSDKDEVDHSVLHKFVKGPECKIYPKKKVKDKKGFDIWIDDMDQLPIIEQTRDLGATVSCLVEIIKDLSERIEALEKK